MKLIVVIPSVFLDEINYGAVMFRLGQRYIHVDDLVVITEKESKAMQEALDGGEDGDVVVIYEGDYFQEITLVRKKEEVYN